MKNAYTITFAAAHAMNDSRSGYTYRQSGVDINAGNALVEAIKPLAHATRRPGADAALGGFGALFDLRKAGFDDPILVAANDGVGTKLRIAIDTARHETIGIDLVAMCVNDLVVQGAEPLFFLDYFATGALDTAVAKRVIEGIAEGCRRAGAALIGGETAEMPGVYAAGDYDLAGFAVGAVERGRILPRTDVVSGDIILGLLSSGPHSNGYSLIRRLIADNGLAYPDPAPFDESRTLGEALLEPTRIYVRSVLETLAGRHGSIKALAHITGGGLTENLPRVLPGDVAAAIDLDAMTPPAVFAWLARVGPVDTTEMLRTFNCGVGMAIVVTADRAEEVADALTAGGETVTTIGEIVPRHEGPAVTYRGRLFDD